MPDDLDRLKSALADRYPIERELGSGGMATVYLARDVKHDRDVAVKVMHPELAAALGTERFLREIKLTASLSHPHILPLIDSGEAGGFLFYVMPFIEGETLRQRLDREHQLPIEEAVRIVQQVARALSHAHSLGVVHRDIKPENILLTGEQAVVADFGIARAVTEAGGEKLTQTGLALGTPTYMSPELATGRSEVDVRSDIYALGCVLYEMLVGEPPFTGPTSQAVLARHAVDPVPSLRTVRLTISGPLEQAVFKALAKVPADRYRTAEEFGAALTTLTTPEYGVPMGGMSGAVQDRAERRRAKPWESIVRPMRAHPVIAVGGLVILLAAAVIGGKTLGASRAAAWVDGRPASVVVVPFSTSTSTARERAMASDLADDITRELNKWESIRAIPSVSLSGPLFDLGLPGPTLELIEDGISVARAVGAQALAAVTLNLRGDTAFVEATLFDARGQKSVGPSIQASGAANEMLTLVAPVVYGILGIDQVTADPGELRRLTAVPAALARLTEGQRYLASWRLGDAERSFRQAIVLDTSFATAMNNLAQTLYWQAAPSDTRLEGVGPEISSLSAFALRHSAGLPIRDSMHIAAFYAFQQGDYPTARQHYQSILRSDSTDVYAWLMLGSVEFKDPWLQEKSPRLLGPRGNLNVAIRAFSEAVRLQPTFDLGYGHLFEIYKVVTESIDRGTCGGFELPRDEFIAPWGDKTPYRARAFCAVALDSIEWVTKAAFDSLDASLIEAGATRLFDQSVQAIRRWADFAPGLAQPREEIAAAMLARRARLRLAAPESIDSLGQLALESAAQALALKGDTLPFDLLRLGGLYLGAGDPAEAVRLTDEAFARYGSAPRNQLAVNVLLASGQPLRALSLVSSSTKQTFLPDSVADSLIPYGGAEVIIERIRVLAATGVEGTRIRRELDALRRVWSLPRYSERQIQLLRRSVTFDVAPALASDDSALAAWDDGLGLDIPLWRALVVSKRDSVTAHALLRQAVGSKVPGVSQAERAFILGVVATRIGDQGQAGELFARLDSLPLRVDGPDRAWGLRSLSYLMRARAYEANRDTQRAVQSYEHFIGAWTNADSLTKPLVDEARRDLRRLKPG